MALGTAMMCGSLLYSAFVTALPKWAEGRIFCRVACGRPRHRRNSRRHRLSRRWLWASAGRLPGRPGTTLATSMSWRLQPSRCSLSPSVLIAGPAGLIAAAAARAHDRYRFAFREPVARSAGAGEPAWLCLWCALRSRPCRHAPRVCCLQRRSMTRHGGTMVYSSVWRCSLSQQLSWRWPFRAMLRCLLYRGCAPHGQGKAPAKLPRGFDPIPNNLPHP